MEQGGPIMSASSGRGKQAALGLIIAAAIIAGVGAIGQFSGAGWFGYRTWMYEPGELYVLNMNTSPLYVSVDGLEAVEVPAQNAQLVELLGGTSEVVVTNEQGEVEATHQITIDGSHALLKLSQEKCLAVVDIGAYYRKGASAKPRVVDKLPKDQIIHVLGSRNVVWPRKDIPKRFSGGDGDPLWVEIVGCPLLEDEDFLTRYFAHRLREKITEDQMPVRRKPPGM